MRNLPTRYVLALGDDADVVADLEGVSVVERLENVVVVEAELGLAKALAMAGEYVHVYSSAHDALRALALFRTAS
jgi:hypothetical protein